MTNNGYKGILYKRKDLDNLKYLTSIRLNIIKLKRELRGKLKGQWELKDIEYLTDNWGKRTPLELMQDLSKTKCSLTCQVNRLGLKNWLLYSKYVTLVDLYGQTAKSGVINYIWYKKQMMKFNAPIETVNLYGEKEIDVIELEKFYEWYKDKIHLLDFFYTDKSLFKNAPDWFKEKLKADELASKYVIKRDWTKSEDNKLKKMISQNKGYREISITLKRTGKAVKRRVYDLNIQHPPKAYNQIKWTDEEIETVKDMFCKGYKPCVIQQHLNRSELSIMAILERNNYFGCEIMRFRCIK